MSDVTKPRVLLAEDDEDMRTLVAAVLAREGYEVIEAASGGEALDLVADPTLFGGDGRPPDLIITDVCMPGVTGLSLLDGVRDAGWATPIIAMTAYGSDIAIDARARGAAAVLQKPFGIEDLRAVVTRVMRRAPEAPPAGGAPPR